MRCPACSSGIGYSFLTEECIDGGDTFLCPSCHTHLRLIEDESTYTGAVDRYLEIVDDDS